MTRNMSERVILFRLNFLQYFNTLQIMVRIKSSVSDKINLHDSFVGVRMLRLRANPSTSFWSFKKDIYY